MDIAAVLPPLPLVERGEAERGNVEGLHLHLPHHDGRAATADNGCHTALAPEVILVPIHMTRTKRAVVQDHGTDPREADPLQGTGEPIRVKKGNHQPNLGRSQGQEPRHLDAQMLNLAQNTSVGSVSMAPIAISGIHQNANIIRAGIVVKVTDVPSYIRNQRIQRRQHRRGAHPQRHELEDGRNQKVPKGQLRLTKGLVFFKQPETVCRKRGVQPRW